MSKKMKRLPAAPPATGHTPPAPQPAPASDLAAPFASHVAQAARGRQDAWDMSAAPAFGDLVLHPWSHERHTLAARLIAGDVPGPSLDELQLLHETIRANDRLKAVALSVCVDLTPYVATAEKILYLAAHDFHEFSHLRGAGLSRFFSAIAEWSAQVITPDSYEEACITAHRIITQHRACMAIPQARKGGGSLKN